MKIKDNGNYQWSTNSETGRLGEQYSFTPENKEDRDFLESLKSATNSVWDKYNQLSDRQRRKRDHPVVMISGSLFSGFPVSFCIYPLDSKD